MGQTPTSNRPVSKQRKTWLLILAGIGLLLAVGGAGYWMGMSKEEVEQAPLSIEPSNSSDDVHPHAEKLKNPDGSWKYTNHLIHETSPYLLLHAHNPVDWYPWGPEALELSRAEDRPIFLSVGYSTCYWCHVMERLVFSDPEIAALMNRWFVNIKVDREERPDLDEIYMTATRIISGHGGWPNSVFLTPDLEPFFAGTYFPPYDDQRFGRPGFPRVLRVLHDAWTNQRPEVNARTQPIVAAIRRMETGLATAAGTAALNRGLLDRAIQRLKERYDDAYGGFGGAPKFPPDQALELLLAEYERKKTPRLLEIAAHTLKMMAQGGMHDHLGGGFHRYSTDARWWVPHFEKMLYNQALLAKVYLHAYRTTGEEAFRRTAEGIFHFVDRVMTSPEGGFYSALDSETHGKEGEYYLWTEEEVRRILRADADLFLKVYNLAPMPEGEGKVLFMPRTLKAAAATVDLSPEALQIKLRPLRQALLQVRQQRERPLLDTKIVTAWNGMLIDAYAYGYEVLKEDAYLQKARRAADFILSRLRNREGNLMRTYREGRVKYEGYQEDYAFLIQGLLGIYRASGEDPYLRHAADLTARMERLFWDTDQGGFYFTTGTESLLVRTKNPYEAAIPSGNAEAVHALLTLSEITGVQDHAQRAHRTMRAFAGLMNQNPGAFNRMLLGVLRYLETAPASPEPPSTPAPSPGSETVLAPPLPKGEDLVQARAVLTEDHPAPGKPFQIALTLQVVDGWHINANPASLDFLVPTELKITSDLPVEVLSIEYPPARELALGFADQPLAVYEGEVTVRATLKLGPEAKPEIKGLLHLQLDFQACDDSRCLPPASLTLPLEIVPARLQQTSGARDTGQ